VADKATVPIYYESRVAKLGLNQSELSKIDEEFEAIRTPSVVGVFPAPQNLRLEYTGMSGELLLKFDRVINANNYSVQTAASSEGPWEDQGLSTTVRVNIDGLTPGKVCWARVCANGSAGASEWGGPATAMAV
jgi:hypothetical protein